MRYTGRSGVRAARAVNGVSTPVRTSAVSKPALVPPRMSVSSRSPTTSGRSTPWWRAAVVNSGASGFPATSGTRPVAAPTAATSVPLPGAIPRACGIERSVLVATQSAPRPTANAASARSFHPSEGSKPWITASGVSSAEETICRPAASTAAASVALPVTRTLAPGSTLEASSSAPAWAEPKTF